MNPIDGMVSFFDPAKGVARKENRLKLQAYRAYEGANTRPRGRNPRGAWRGVSGRDHEDKALPWSDRIALICEIQDLMRNDGGLIETIMDRICEHSVGMGVFPVPHTTDDSWNGQSADYFVNYWSKTFDYEGRQGFHFIGPGQKLFIREAFDRGESLPVLLNNGQVQWYESEQCRTPDKLQGDSVQNGLKVSKTGVVQGYHFVLTVSDGKSRDIYHQKRNVVHAMDYRRARQRRGIPLLAPLVPKFQDFLETDEAMRKKVKNEAKQNLKITGKGPGGRTMNEMPFGGSKQDANSNGFDVVKMMDEMIYDLDEGRDINMFGTVNPSNESMAYMDQYITMLAAATGIPREVLMMLASGSYAAKRGLQLDFERTVMRWWSYVVAPSQRFWNWSIAKGIKAGHLPPAPTITLPNGQERSQWDRVEWTRPQRKSMTPKEDESVSQSRITTGKTSITRELKTENLEREDVWNERQVEMLNAAERAAEMNKQHPDAGFTWRDFVNTDRPGQAAKPAQTPKDQPENPDA